MLVGSYVCTALRSLPGLRPQAAGKIGKTVCRASSSSPEDYADMSALNKLWYRAPPRPSEFIPLDQKEFCFSRVDMPDKYLNFCIPPKTPNLVYNPLNIRHTTDPRNLRVMHTWAKNAIFAVPLKEQLPPLKDIIAGCRHVVLQILDCLVKTNVRPLRPLVFGDSMLDFHRRTAPDLTDVQRNALRIVEDDFLSDGYMWNHCPFGSDIAGPMSRYVHDFTITRKDAVGGMIDRPVLKYSVVLAALRQKSALFKLARSLPYSKTASHKDDRMLMKMPAGYGFVAPRYTIIRLEMCHNIVSTKRFQPKLDEDAMLYDFHVHSF